MFLLICVSGPVLQAGRRAHYYYTIYVVMCSVYHVVNQTGHNDAPRHFMILFPPTCFFFKKRRITKEGITLEVCLCGHWTVMTVLTHVQTPGRKPFVDTHE